MTYKEALKVIDLNKDKLCGSMQEAIKTVCLEVPMAYCKGRDDSLLNYIKLLRDRIKAVGGTRADNETFGFNTTSEDAVLDELKGLLGALEIVAAEPCTT